MAVQILNPLELARQMALAGEEGPVIVSGQVYGCVKTLRSWDDVTEEFDRYREGGK